MKRSHRYTVANSYTVHTEDTVTLYILHEDTEAMFTQLKLNTVHVYIHVLWVKYKC